MFARMLKLEFSEFVRKQATIEALELIDWMGLSNKANVLAGALPTPMKEGWYCRFNAIA